MSVAQLDAPKKGKHPMPITRPLVIEGWSFHPAQWEGHDMPPRRHWQVHRKHDRSWSRGEIYEPPSKQAFIVSSSNMPVDAFVNWDDAVDELLRRIGKP
jgi:hypothetical protein